MWPVPKESKVKIGKTKVKEKYAISSSPLSCSDSYPTQIQGLIPRLVIYTIKDKDTILNKTPRL